MELHTLWAAMTRPKIGDKRAAVLGAAANHASILFSLV